MGEANQARLQDVNGDDINMNHVDHVSDREAGGTMGGDDDGPGNGGGRGMDTPYSERTAVWSDHLGRKDKEGQDRMGSER